MTATETEGEQAMARIENLESTIREMIKGFEMVIPILEHEQVTSINFVKNTQTSANQLRAGVERAKAVLSA
jgi:hypothetical protein